MAASLADQKTSLDEVLSKHGFEKQDLDTECSESVRFEIAIKIIEWQLFGHYVGIPDERLHAIKVDNTTEEQRRIALLSTWHTQQGREATYYKLIRALYNRRRLDLVNFLCQLIKQHQQSRQQLNEASCPAALATPSDGQLQPKESSG